MTSEADSEQSELERASEVLLNQHIHTWEDVMKARNFLANEPFDEGQLEAIKEIGASLAGDTAYQEYKAAFVEWWAEELRKIAEEKPDVESFPPPVLQIYRTLHDLVSRHYGFLISVRSEDWWANPGFKNISFTAIYPDNPYVTPVTVNIIYAKSDEHIATREEICDSLAERIKSGTASGGRYNNGSSISSYRNHGIEVSIDYHVGYAQSGVSFYPKEILEALAQVCGKELKKRDNVWQVGDSSWDVGHRVFYAPQTLEEEVCKVPEKNLDYFDRLTQRRSLGEPLTAEEKAFLENTERLMRAWDF